MAAARSTRNKMEAVVDELRQVWVQHGHAALTYPLSRPAVAGPLLHQRDLILAYNAKRAEGVQGCDAVVLVVGVAHVHGVHFLLEQNLALRAEHIDGVRNLRATPVDDVMAGRCFPALPSQLVDRLSERPLWERLRFWWLAKRFERAGFGEGSFLAFEPVECI
jgi:hypothetical protein